MSYAPQAKETTVQRLEALGIDPSQAQITSDDWAMRLMEGGVIVSLHIGRWGGKTSLKPEDLGIKLSDDPDTRRKQQALLVFGSKHLLPTYLLRNLASVESQARQNLTNCSISTVFGSYLTPAAWERFRARHESLKADYFALRDQILERYDSLIDEMRSEYESMAHDAWRRSRRRGPDQYAPDEYVSSYLDRVIAAFPTKEYIRESFSFEAVPTLIPLPSMLAEDMTKAEEIQDEAALQQALRRDVARYWRERKREMVDGFLVDLVAQIRGQAYEVLASALETAERNEGKLPAKTLQGLDTMIQTVRTLDPYGDQELETAFRRLRGQLERPAKDRDAGEIVRQVDDLATVIRASLVLMDRAPRRGNGEIEQTVPTIQQVRQARERLGIEQVEVSPVVQAALARGGRSL